MLNIAPSTCGTPEGSWSKSIALWHSGKAHLKKGSKGKKICEEQSCKHQGERRLQGGDAPVPGQRSSCSPWRQHAGVGTHAAAAMEDPALAQGDVP